MIYFLYLIMRLLKFIGLLLTLVVLSFTALDLIYKNYITEADRIFTIYNSKAAKINTLLIGNSHLGVCNYTLPPNNMQTGNICLGNIDIFRMYSLLKVILPHSPQLQKVYISLDYDMLGYNQTQCGQKYMDYACYKYTGELYNNSFTNRLMSRSHFFRANRDITYLFRAQQADKPVNYIPLNVTTSGSTAVKKPNLVHCRQRAEDATRLKFKTENLTENLNYLRGIVDLCNHYKAEPIFVNTPKTATYKSFCDKVNIEVAKKLILNFCAQNKVTYIDLYNDTEFNDSLFTDGDHLNFAGAKLLVQKISPVEKIANYP